MNTKQRARIVTLDIETAPTLAHVWRFHKENIGLDQIERHGFVLCVGWKYLGARAVHCVGNDLRKPMDDAGTVRAAWAVLNDADIVVAHNGKAFDLPILNARFMVHRLGPPKPYRVVDTLDVAKRKFRFPMNKLDCIAQQLGVGRKIKTDFHLWLGCLNGDARAWSQMMRYNRQDVALLERVYLAMLPFIETHPNLALWGNLDKPRCPKCGSAKLERSEEARTLTQIYERYKCLKCGGWTRTRRTIVDRRESCNILQHAVCG